MENYVIARELPFPYKENKEEITCDVLFPDGTIIENGIVTTYPDGMKSLRIIIHGWELGTFQSGLKGLKFKVK